MTYEEAIKKLQSEASIGKAILKAMGLFLIYLISSFLLYVLWSFLKGLLNYPNSFSVDDEILYTKEVEKVFLHDYTTTYAIILEILILIVYTVHSSVFFKRNYLKFIDEEYAKAHSVGYYYLSKKIQPYLEDLQKTRLEVQEITYDKGYYTIVYRMHMTLHTIRSNNVKVLATDAPDIFLRAKCINSNIMWGYMQYDLYDIEIATKEPLEKVKKDDGY